jgi:hypothetical protein
MWTLAYWLTSDWLETKRRALMRREVRRRIDLALKESRKYRAYKWGVSFLIVGLSGGLVLWTVSTKREYERNDTANHLTVTHYIPSGYADDPMYTMFSVSNGGNVVISKHHKILCDIRLAVGNHGSSPISNMVTRENEDGTTAIGDLTGLSQTIESSGPMRPGGDAESSQCLIILRQTFVDGGSDCVDMTLIFLYTLETQPDLRQEKGFRFVAEKGGNGRFDWAQRPLESVRNYCAPSLKKSPGL